MKSKLRVHALLHEGPINIITASSETRIPNATLELDDGAIPTEAVRKILRRLAEREQSEPSQNS